MNAARSQQPLKSPGSLRLAKNKGTDMLVISVHEPSGYLIVAPGSGIWRRSRSSFMRSMSPRPIKRIARARRMGHLVDVDRLAYDPAATAMRIRRDCIGRRVMTVGPSFIVTYLCANDGSDDLHRELDRLFINADDADRAVRDVARRMMHSGTASVMIADR
jgi:hypothetical protein